jgi:hypothetical protein
LVTKTSGNYPKVTVRTTEDVIPTSMVHERNMAQAKNIRDLIALGEDAPFNGDLARRVEYLEDTLRHIALLTHSTYTPTHPHKRAGESAMEALGLQKVYETEFAVQAHS